MLIRPRARLAKFEGELPNVKGVSGATLAIVLAVLGLTMLKVLQERRPN